MSATRRLANMIFANIHDRKGESILSVRDQNTFAEAAAQEAPHDPHPPVLDPPVQGVSVHYVSPTEDNHYQTARMKHHGIFSDVHSEIGQIIVAMVNAERVAELLEPDRVALTKLIDKTGPPSQ